MAMKNFGWPEEMKREVLGEAVAPQAEESAEKEVLTQEARRGAVGCVVTMVGLLSLIVGITALTDWRVTCVVVGVLLLSNAVMRRN